ncbi:hypothetical protein OEZ85_011918 [Tetradesmus obliquus]|uniref:Uncharacterized protein n=1 Tax=Tetradesmus obliquus TaxID=3088 RepID=A0ABY8TRU7_TETOB|nr:hypothetical protein OEZ85_011918 [Tetradesmus obliquus]
MSLHDLLMVLQPRLGEADDSLHTRRQLFLSQLARKHPVAFFQFLDICARCRPLDAATAGRLVLLSDA